MKKRHWNAKAFHTLEAALILPTVFLLTAGLIFLGFMLHDMLVLHALTADFAELAVDYIRNPQQMDGKLDASRLSKSFTGFQYEELTDTQRIAYRLLLLDEADKRTLIYHPCDAGVTQDGKNVTVQISGSFPVKILRLLPGSSETYISTAREEIGYNVQELIRLSKAFSGELKEDADED